ncbi:MAG: RusA family crossover junction endodeoxyribonuclease [Myxococcota bacterium]
MAEIALSVPMAPKGKGRPRLGRRGQHAVVYTPKATQQWERAFAGYVLGWVSAQRANGAAISLPLDGPLEIDVVAVLPRPKRLTRRKDPDGLIWAPVKPDHDNIEKAVFDALQISVNGVQVVADDARIVAQPTFKVYAEKNGEPRVIVRLRPVSDDSMTKVQELANSISGHNEAIV